MSWRQTLEVLAQHRCLTFRLNWVSILFLQAHMSACCKVCRDPLWRNLNSEILLCCGELRISLIWALRVSFAAGHLTSEFAETKEPLVFEASESVRIGSKAPSITDSSVLFPCRCGQDKVPLPAWVRKGTCRKSLFVFKSSWRIHWLLFSCLGKTPWPKSTWGRESLS